MSNAVMAAYCVEKSKMSKEPMRLVERAFKKFRDENQNMRVSDMTLQTDVVKNSDTYCNMFLQVSQLLDRCAAAIIEISRFMAEHMSENPQLYPVDESMTNEEKANLILSYFSEDKELPMHCPTKDELENGYYEMHATHLMAAAKKLGFHYQEIEPGVLFIEF